MVKKTDKDKKIEILIEDFALLEDYVRDLFSFTPLAIFFISPKGVILEANPALEKMVERDVYELIGDSANNIFTGNEIEEVVKKTAEEGLVEGRLAGIRKKNGVEIPVSIFSKARKSKEGEITGYFIGLLDMTEIEKANEKLEDSKKILEIKVAARTRELKELANSLESKVQERTVELKDKLEELEKINRLMVGRELKMIEIKEQLEKAKKEISKLEEKFKKSENVD